MINTREIATEYRLSHWAQIIRERQESGLSIRAYCKQAGFHENRFFYWQRRVRRAACEQLTENNHETASTIQAINNFTEVKLLPTPERFPLSHAAMHSELRIDIAGLRITTDQTYPPMQLAELLKGLISSC